MRESYNNLERITSFNLSLTPRIIFGAGSVSQLGLEIESIGKKPLLVTGGKSFVEGPHWQKLTTYLTARGIEFEHSRVRDEPDVDLIDKELSRLRASNVDVVVGIGGGSAIDVAKALAGMLPISGSISGFLEGSLDQKPYRGEPLPIIAVPTTAGTGSEATKNAVITMGGEIAVKRSFRHERLVPVLALTDPELLESCPAEIMLANAMDAFTQLLESYLSVRSNPVTDALALDAIERFVACFDPKAPDKKSGLSTLAYAALISGVCLAQTGLGSVHGVAAPLGANLKIPHGIACGTTLAAAVEVNVKALKARIPNSPALKRYSTISGLFGKDRAEDLADSLWVWREQSEISGLADFGLTPDLVQTIVSNSRGNSMRTNPVELSDNEIASILIMSM